MDFVIESTYPATNTPSYHEWEDILIDNNYKFAYAHGINRYYVSGEKAEELMNGFIGVDELKKNYEIYRIYTDASLEENMYYKAGWILLSPARILVRFLRKLRR